MLFNSLVFLVFAAVFYPVFLGLRSQRARLGVLTAASFLFYGYWDPRFLLLLLGTGLLDFWAALAIVRYPQRKKAFLVASMSANVGALAFFKYAGFFLDNVDGLARALGLPGIGLAFHVVLPVGISFYTFQSMSYTIDVYRGHLTPTKSVLHFLASLSLFPHLVAGPIVRASTLLPQIETRRDPTSAQIWEGWRLIVRGYVKKCFVADTLAAYVNAAFGGDPSAHSAAYWWLSSAMFAVQIYGDFSGYTDIAIGLAKWMGLELPKNFEHPYLARSFREFWQRWHISLSSWFRDYVYIPLGGAEGGPVRAHANLWATMLLSGLWHGASWNFVLWGALHASFLSIERITRWPERLKPWGAAGGAFSLALVFPLTLVSWVLFRASNLGQAGAILARMADLGTLGDLTDALDGRRFGVVVLGLVFLRHLYVGLNIREWCEEHLPMDTLRVGIAAAAALIAVYLRGPGQQFIYFQF